MITPSISVDPAELARLEKYMLEFQRKTGRSCEAAVNWTASQLARSLAAQTRVAPKRRKVIKNKETGGWMVEIWRNGQKKLVNLETDGSRIIKRRSRRTGQELLMDTLTKQFAPVSHPERLPAANKSQVRANHPMTRIENSGIAKKTWYGLGGGSGITIRSRRGIQTGRREQRTIHDFGGQSYEISIHNQLRYAINAFKNGAASVQIASHNAGTQMGRKIHNDLLKLTQ